MVAAAVEVDKPERVRAVVAESGVKLPVYLANAETRQRFGATQVDPPLNVLIDADGRIATLARGTSPQTIQRIADQAQRLLDELGPADDTRFANVNACQFPNLAIGLKLAAIVECIVHRSCLVARTCHVELGR